jgi:hypothetical protein
MQGYRPLNTQYNIFPFRLFVLLKVSLTKLETKNNAGRNQDDFKEN